VKVKEVSRSTPGKARFVLGQPYRISPGKQGQVYGDSALDMHRIVTDGHARRCTNNNLGQGKGCSNAPAVERTESVQFRTVRSTGSGMNSRLT
jgi:hypothetical protein